VKNEQFPPKGERLKERLRSFLCDRIAGQRSSKRRDRASRFSRSDSYTFAMLAQKQRLWRGIAIDPAEQTQARRSAGALACSRQPRELMRDGKDGF
jgi:hypothetical protein